MASSFTASPRGGTRSSASTPPRSARPTSSRARSACSAASWRRTTNRRSSASSWPTSGAARGSRAGRRTPRTAPSHDHAVGYPHRSVHPDGGCPPVLLPLVGLLVGVLAGLILNVNVSFEFSRYSAVAILAALDSVLGAVRAELDGVYDNRIFISGFLTNAIVAVLLTFIGDRLSLDLYLVALINFGFRIFNNTALIRRHFI